MIQTPTQLRNYTHQSPPLHNNPPRNPTNNGIAQPDIPRLQSVQIRIRRLPADQPKRMKGIVYKPILGESMERFQAKPSSTGLGHVSQG